jgi:hypothetical protein
MIEIEKKKWFAQRNNKDLTIAINARETTRENLNTIELVYSSMNQQQDN